MTSIARLRNRWARRAPWLVLALALAGCSDRSQLAPSPAASPGADLQGYNDTELRAQVRQAVQERRIYGPAGNNAIEYYLALRERSATPVATVESALVELQPYAVIAAEQALVRQDFAEAQRLHQLIAAADPDAPSLRRLAAGIAGGQAAALQRVQGAAQLAAEEKIAADARQAERLLAAQTQALPAVAPVQPPPAPRPEAAVLVPVPLLPRPTAAPSAPVAPTSAPEPPAAPARSVAELVPVRAPQPIYPTEAQRSRIAGEVEVTFAVNADGSVGNVVIVRASPAGVFERNVQAALRRWKFKPIASAMTVSRVFKFAP